MRVSQLHWSEPTGWVCESGGPQPADLVLYFGTLGVFAAGARYGDLRATAHAGPGEIFPHAASGCREWHNQTMTVTALSEAA